MSVSLDHSKQYSLIWEGGQDVFPSTRLVFTKSCRLNFSMSGSSSIGDGGGGNMGNVNQPPTTAASSTCGSSAPWPAAKRSLETGTVSLEFLPKGGEVVNLDVDLHLHVLRVLIFVLQQHKQLHLHLNLHQDLSLCMQKFTGPMDWVNKTKVCNSVINSPPPWVEIQAKQYL